MKTKRKILLPIFVLVFLTVLAIADIPPPPVNQNFGIYDTAAINYSETLCRGCHNSISSLLVTGGVPTRHHNLVINGVTNPVTNLAFVCTDCHPQIPGLGNEILLDRNCIDCHNRTTFWGNSIGAIVGKFTGPHHNTTQAQVRDCKFCHGASVDNYNDGHYISPNPPTATIPSALFQTLNLTSGRVWGGCLACHAENASATPPIFFTQTIPSVVGGKYSSAPFAAGVNNIHHNEIVAIDNPSGVTSGDCLWCHPIQDDVLNIRGCEACHSVRSIHNTQFDFTNTNTKIGYGHIGSNNPSDIENNSWDCKGCHGSTFSGTNPFAGSIVPDIQLVTPSVFGPSIPTVLTITGTNFVQAGSTTVVNIDGTTIIPSTITNGQITVTVNLVAGNHYIKVVKTDPIENVPKPSNIRPLTVVKRMVIISAKLDNFGNITILGLGFGNRPLINDQQYVTINQTGNVYYSDNILSWGPFKIMVNKTSTPAAVVGDTVTVVANNSEASAKITIA